MHFTFKTVHVFLCGLVNEIQELEMSATQKRLDLYSPNDKIEMLLKHYEKFRAV